jgi:hypothetical protein
MDQETVGADYRNDLSGVLYRDDWLYVYEAF